MVLKVIWSEFAEKQLEAIFDYYPKNISEITAKKIADIFDTRQNPLKITRKK